MTSYGGSGLPSSVCGSASDSTYTNTDQSSIRSADQQSLAPSTTSKSKPKRTVRFQDPTPVDSLASEVDFHPGPNLSLSSLDLSDSSSTSSVRRSRQSLAVPEGNQPSVRSSSPRFARPLSAVRPQMRRDPSVTSTASAPGELEFTDWLARMEERKSLPREAPEARRKGAADKEERKKKKRRSWVNLLVR